MKIKHCENLRQTDWRKCCLQTFEMLTPSDKSSNFHMPNLSLIVLQWCTVLLFQIKHKTIIKLSRLALLIAN